MRIYEIDREIEALLEECDPETGEALFDEEKLAALEAQRETAVEQLALGYKNLAAEAEAIKAEAAALTKRQRTAERQAENAKRYLEFLLKGEKFRTARVAVSYRQSERLEIGEGFLPWAVREAPGLLREREPEADRTAIRRALKNGGAVPFTELVPCRNMLVR